MGLDWGVSCDHDSLECVVAPVEVDETQELVRHDGKVEDEHFALDNDGKRSGVCEAVL